MIEFLPQSHDNVFGIKAVGKVTKEDYETILIPKVNELLAANETVKALYYLSEEFEGFELGAMWDDAKYLGGHSDRFSKIALVGGPKWMEIGTKITGAFMKTEVETFESDKLPEAWTWLDE